MIHFNQNFHVCMFEYMYILMHVFQVIPNSINKIDCPGLDEFATVNQLRIQPLATISL